MATATFSLDNEVCSRFAFYAGVVLLKTLLMALWTAKHRFHKKVFASPEDYLGKKNVSITTDPGVERVRRCHLNDLENVLPFVLVGLLYLMTGPDLSTAVLHFRLFAGSRYFHTLAYLVPLPQPCRALSFGVGYYVTLFMLYKVLMATCPCL